MTCTTVHSRGNRVPFIGESRTPQHISLLLDRADVLQHSLRRWKKHGLLQSERTPGLSPTGTSSSNQHSAPAYGYFALRLIQFMQKKAPGAQPRAGGSPHHRDCLFALFRWQGADVLDHRFHFLVVGFLKDTVLFVLSPRRYLQKVERLSDGTAAFERFSDQLVPGNGSAAKSSTGASSALIQSAQARSAVNLTSLTWSGKGRAILGTFELQQ